MKIVKNYVLPIAVCAAEILVGILLLAKPVGFIGAIVAGAGVAAVAAGIWWGIRYFKAAPLVASHEQNLSKGVGAVIFGVFCLFQFLWIAEAMPFMGMVFGAAILVTGVLKTQRAVDLLRLHRTFWYISGIGALLALALGAVVMANPFSDAFLWGFIGVGLIVIGAVDLAGMLLSGKTGVAGKQDAAPVAAMAEGEKPLESGAFAETLPQAREAAEKVAAKGDERAAGQTAGRFGTPAVEKASDPAAVSVAELTSAVAPTAAPAVVDEPEGASTSVR